MRNVGSTPRLLTGLAALVLASSVMAHGHDRQGEVHVMPIDELKNAYLSCSRAALQSRPDNGNIMHCSVIYEALKRRAFNGDFEKLLAWSQAQPRPATSRSPGS